MLHFLVKIGKKPWAKFVVPTIASTTSFGYYSCHTYFHDQFRNLLAAYQPNGRREEVSDNLKSLIISVFKEVKEHFEKPLFPGDEMNFKDPSFKWFASSTLEPITFGMTELKSGVMIGLPSFYNFNKPEQLPDHLFEIEQLKFFRSPQDPEKESNEMKSLDDNRKGSTVIKKSIVRNSSEGQEYANSLLLSENAIRFSIARELFLADTYRPMVIGVGVLLSFGLALAFGRAGVHIMKLKEAHITYRISCYALTGSFGTLHQILMSNSINQYYARKADEKAIGLGEAYKEGASEYYRKRAVRNKILGISTD